MIKTIGKYALTWLLWSVSSVLGGIGVIQVYEATRVVTAFAVPVDPLQEVMSRKQVLLVSRVALVLLTIGWIVAIILLLVRYLRVYSAIRRVWRVFLITTVVELIVIGLSTAIVYYLPGLALSGGG
jgi:hypothetical protein